MACHPCPPTSANLLSFHPSGRAWKLPMQLRSKQPPGRDMSLEDPRPRDVAIQDYSIRRSAGCRIKKHSPPPDTAELEISVRVAGHHRTSTTGNTCDQPNPSVPNNTVCSIHSARPYATSTRRCWSETPGDGMHGMPPQETKGASQTQLDGRDTPWRANLPIVRSRETVQYLHWKKRLGEMYV